MPGAQYLAHHLLQQRFHDTIAAELHDLAMKFAVECHVPHRIAGVDHVFLFDNQRLQLAPGGFGKSRNRLGKGHHFQIDPDDAAFDDPGRIGQRPLVDFFPRRQVRRLDAVAQKVVDPWRRRQSAVNQLCPAAANAAGIVCIFQELSLIPDLSVADNIVISNPPRRWGPIDRRAQHAIAAEALARAGGGDIDPREIVKNLPQSRRQIVEIAKALARKPRVLILDEAMSALTAADVTTVFAMLRRLRDEGLALLYISHRMHEIAPELADDGTAFRNGRNVATYKAGERTDSAVVELMIGREYSHKFPPRPAPLPATAPPVREVRNLAWAPRLNGISLIATAGEVVGLGGLDGQGQRELLLALFGVLRGVTGEVLMDGAPCAIGSPRMAKSPAVGMALIPQDRKTARPRGWCCRCRCATTSASPRWAGFPRPG